MAILGEVFVLVVILHSRSPQKWLAKKKHALLVWFAALFYSPVRSTPVVGVTPGAHYRRLSIFFTSSHKPARFAGALKEDASALSSSSRSSRMLYWIPIKRYTLLIINS